MPSIRARDVIEPALRLLGVSSSEEPVQPDMAQAGLLALNALLDAWAVDRLMIPRRPKLTLPLVAGKPTYSWGYVRGELTPADVSAPAPVRLELCVLSVTDGSTQEWELTVLEQRDYETGIWLKQMTSSYPECVYLDPTRPYATLYVWPIPEWPYQLRLFPWPALPLYPHWDSIMDWPEGYLRALQYALAVDLGPQYGVEASPTVQRVAMAARQDLSPVNARVGRLSPSPGGEPMVSEWARFQRGY